MCGIVGIISPNDPDSIGRSKIALNRMSSHIIKRGPDEEGYFFSSNILLGMRRLSILDLNHGTQPFYSEDRNVVAFQNGEIYNHNDVRDILAKSDINFHTSCDTEVIPHAYHTMGIDQCLKSFEGMFAIAIYDRTSNKLHLARDRFGEKPLYYYSDNSTFIFSSNLESILQHNDIDDTFDTTGFHFYMRLHFFQGSQTPYKRIHQLPPGHYLTYDLDTGSINITRYYNFDKFSEEELGSLKLDDILEDAIRSRLISDVPTGVFLSGGLDSSVVSAVAKKNNDRIHTFSMGFDSLDHDESEHAKDLAAYLDTNHHSFVFRQESFLSLLPEVIDNLDIPIGDQAILPTYWLSREASSHVKVVLSGEGADEIFGGYFYYDPDRAASSDFFNNPAGITCSGFPVLMSEPDANRLLDHELDSNSVSDLLHYSYKPAEAFNHQGYFDLVTWLANDLLIKLDRMTMAASIEGRAPYLDTKLVEYCLKILKSSDKTDDKSNKLALRQAARRYIPQSILGRKKQGFILPMQKWITEFINSRDGITNYLGSIDTGPINKKALREVLEANHKARNERLLFSLLVLLEWLNK